jgi:5'-3' exonuclease
MARRLMLIDSASLYFRAFFGVPDARAPDGTPVNAVRGFLDFITTLVSRYEPGQLVCCWDDDWRPAWRVELIPSYKAHRVAVPKPRAPDIEETPELLVPQVPIIEEVLDALQIAVVGAPGCEADDVLGTLSSRSSGPVDVVTGDRDLFQLVDDDRDVRVLYTGRGVGKLEILDERAVVTKYGILPEQYTDFAVMRGDPSDGLPGVKGIGEKTATGLLSQYGDLEGILEAAADPGSTISSGVRSRLAAAGDYLAVAPRVVAVLRDAQLPDFDPGFAPANAARLAELSERFGLGSALRRAAEAIATRVNELAEQSDPGETRY